MFYPNASTTKECMRRRTILARPITVIICGILAITTSLARSAASFAVYPRQTTANSAKATKDPAVRDIDAERKLLADLETASGAHADHFDFSEFDRDLAAAFRGYGMTPMLSLASAMRSNKSRSRRKP
jgi:hypothetical protein